MQSNRRSLFKSPSVCLQSSSFDVRSHVLSAVRVKGTPISVNKKYVPGCNNVLGINDCNSKGVVTNCWAVGHGNINQLPVDFQLLEHGDKQLIYFNALFSFGSCD